MELSTGTLVLLGAIALALVAVCVRRPRLGIGITILSFIPAPLWPTDDTVIFFYGFGVFLMLVLWGWLLKASFGVAPFRKYVPSDNIASGLKLWMLLCALGLPLSLLFNRGALSDRVFFYVRGLVPFVYLLVFFVVRALPFTARQAQQVLNYLLSIAIVFAVITFAIYAVTGARVTWVYPTLTFPFAVLGADVTFARMLLAPARRAVFGWALLTGAFGLAALLTFGKGQIIALVLSLGLIAVLISRTAHRTASRMVAFAAAIAICATAFAAFASSQTQSSLSFSELAAARLNDETSTEGRLSEWQAALDAFAESPVVGKGVGYELERDTGDDVVTAEYVHNQIAYTAMTTGLVGLIVYLMLVYNWARVVQRFHEVGAEMVGPLAAIHGCVLTLGVYALMFASFRSIPHNFLLGIFLALCVQLTPRPHPARKSIQQAV